MIASTLLASSLAAAAMVSSQITFQSPELVSPVNAVEDTSNMVLTAPTWYADSVPTRPVESITLALTPPGAAVRAAAVLDEAENEQTAIEVSVFGEVDPSTMKAQLQLGSCEQPDLASVQSLEAFTNHRSRTTLDTPLSVLLNQTEPVSLSLLSVATGEVVGCSNL